MKTSFLYLYSTLHHAEKLGFAEYLGRRIYDDRLLCSEMKEYGMYIMEIRTPKRMRRTLSMYVI